MVQSDQSFVSYTVKIGFHLNLGEASSKQSSPLVPGDTLLFDGVNVNVKGYKGYAPTLRAALREGWICETPQKATPKAKAATPASRPVPLDTGVNAIEIFAPVISAPAPSKPIQSSSPTAQVTRVKVSTSDEQEVSTTRASKTVGAPAVTQAQGAKTSTRGQAATQEEDRVIDAVRTRTGAASPGKAALKAKVASKPGANSLESIAAVVSAPAPSKPIQSSAPAARKRLAVVVDHDDTVITSKRASASKNATVTLDGTTNVGVSDEEQDAAQLLKAQKKSADTKTPAPAGTRAPGEGGRTPSDPKKKIEPQTVDAVYKGRRATPAVTDFQATSDMESVAAPKPMRKEASLVRLDDSGEVEVRKVSNKGAVAHDGAITTRTTVGSNSDISVPEAKSYNTSESIIMGKTATVTSSEGSLEDPDDYLGLKGNTVIEKKSVAVISDDTEVEEDDFSSLNDVSDEDLVEALTPPPAPQADETEVPDNFLDTVIIEGSSWEAAKFFTKMKYISKCTNLSILALMTKDTKLQPSVKKALADRLELLANSVPAKKKK